MSCCSSLLKKYLMALTGLVLAGFVLVHMLGNLQMFQLPEHLNAYAKFLHHGVPGFPVHWELLVWGARIFLGLCVVVHIVTGISLALENRAARTSEYAVKTSRNGSVASKFGFLGNLYMPVSGLVILAFIPFHLLHYTVRAAFTGIVAADYEVGGKFATTVNGEAVDNVYAMVVDGFSSLPVAIFYIVGMVLLFAHLAHGVSSMFQSVGLRNEKWRPRLDCLAKGYAIVVAAGFIAIPVAVQAGLLTREGPKCCSHCTGDSCKAPVYVVPEVPAAK